MSLVSSKYDVVVVGSGPAGAATASMLKAMHRDLNICVLDTRPETRRHYGLSVAKDAIQAMNQTLQNNLRDDNREEIRSFMTSLNQWKGTVQEAQVIEESLTERARKLGVTVLRKEAYKDALTPEGMDKLLGPEDSGLTETQKELRGYFEHAKVIVGADGAHSVVRQRFMEGGDEERRRDVKNLQYFIELKYQTFKETKARDVSGASKEASCTGIGFETMSNKKDGAADLKPATYHSFVGKNTYDAFHQATDKTPWNLNTLQGEAVKHPIIANETLKMARYLKGLLDRGGCCIDPKVKRLPITMYRSVEVVKVVQGRVIAVVGDAASGAVFARGVNKCFLEASVLAQKITDFFRSRQEIHEQIPQEFSDYQKAAAKIFENEKWWAEFKAFWINNSRYVLRYTLKPLKWLFSPLTALKSRLFKEPQLGDLLQRIEGAKINTPTPGK